MAPFVLFSVPIVSAEMRKTVYHIRPRRSTRTGRKRYKAFYSTLVCVAASGAKYFRHGKRSQNVQCFS